MPTPTRYAAAESPLHFLHTFHYTNAHKENPRAQPHYYCYYSAAAAAAGAKAQFTTSGL